MKMLIEAEMRNAATEMSAAIDVAKSEYKKALKKAKEMERSEKGTKFGRRYPY